MPLPLLLFYLLAEEKPWLHFSLTVSEEKKKANNKTTHRFVISAVPA